MPLTPSPFHPNFGVVPVATRVGISPSYSAAKLFLKYSMVIHQLAQLLNLISLASPARLPDSVKGQIVCLQRKDLG